MSPVSKWRHLPTAELYRHLGVSYPAITSGAPMRATLGRTLSCATDREWLP